MTDNKLKLHKINISGPDINREFEVDETLAAQVYQGLIKLTSGSGQTYKANLQNQQGLILEQNLSPQEYLIQANAKTNPEKILAFTKYLIDLGQHAITLTELRLLFQKARESIPGNFGRDVAKSIRLGWIAQGTDLKYYVTNLGEQILESKFSSEKRTIQKTVKRTGKALFVETPLRKEVEQMALDPKLEGFPDYHDLSKSADKILWLLAKAISLNLDKLNQKEITFLSERIGDHIPRKSISALVIPFTKRKRLYTPVEGGVRYLKILDEGKRYLKTLNK